MHKHRQFQLQPPPQIILLVVHARNRITAEVSRLGNRRWQPVQNLDQGQKRELAGYLAHEAQLLRSEAAFLDGARQTADKPAGSGFAREAPERGWAWIAQHDIAADLAELEANGWKWVDGPTQAEAEEEAYWLAMADLDAEQRGLNDWPDEYLGGVLA